MKKIFGNKKLFGAKSINNVGTNPTNNLNSNVNVKVGLSDNHVKLHKFCLVIGALMTLVFVALLVLHNSGLETTIFNDTKTNATDTALKHTLNVLFSVALSVNTAFFAFVHSLIAFCYKKR